MKQATPLPFLGSRGHSLSAVESLTRINLDDLVSSFGWQNYPLPAAVLRSLFIKPARKFARQMVEYDDLVGQVGLHEASRSILSRHYINDLRLHGREHIPASGPALFLSNHPGLADTVSLFTAIDRPDLRVIALHRPFLASLPEITRHLVYISDDPGERMRAVRKVSAHLRGGGAALTFPAGTIEPDPDVHTGALDSLRTWTDSTAIFRRFAPNLQIVPISVSGVVWERTARHWLTRIRKTREEQEKFAAALQLLAMVARDARPTTVQVRFGKPITREEVGPVDTTGIHEILMERMRCLIENQNDGDGVSIL
ncbi:MAG TPA: 1-acyl-sn-glycerol-3-phosphate acyltransferase [Anaerolineales bacterium]|nr:1-acyl-sn-glycerol-3-phosphate acyltransferase [Anaerolineales bacterium]